MVGATWVVSTGLVIVLGANLGFDSSSITLVSSCEKPPCSASFLLLPVNTTPPFGVTMMSGVRGSIAGELNIWVIAEPQ